jgi:hypothetical protein
VKKLPAMEFLRRQGVRVQIENGQEIAAEAVK